MKAKLIKEELNQFTREGDPFDKLQIGYERFKKKLIDILSKEGDEDDREELFKIIKDPLVKVLFEENSFKIILRDNNLNLFLYKFISNFFQFSKIFQITEWDGKNEILLYFYETKN
jgi:hypothetical protein